MEIPEDIMKAAMDAAWEGGIALGEGSNLHMIMARALLAERERATQAERDRINAMWDRGNASAIRTPSTGEETK